MTDRPWRRNQTDASSASFHRRVQRSCKATLAAHYNSAHRHIIRHLKVRVFFTTSFTNVNDSQWLWPVQLFITHLMTSSIVEHLPPRFDVSPTLFLLAHYLHYT